MSFRMPMMASETELTVLEISTFLIYPLGIA